MGVNVNVTNLSVVTRALQQVDTEVRRSATTELHAIGSLVARDAQGLAVSRIRRITPGWSLMHVGQSPSAIYVVPRKKGVRGRGPKRRPNFAPLMLNRAMRPALTRNKPQVTKRYQAVVSAVCSKFNRGGLRG